MRTLTTAITQSITDPIVDPATVRVPVIPLTGLVGWFRASEGLFTDTAMTTAANAQGDLVAAWADQSGSGNHLLQSAAGSRPVLTVAARNGYNGILLNGRFMALASTVTMNACTIFAVANPVAASCIWVSNGDDTTSYLYTSNVIVFKPGATPASTTAGPNTGSWHLAEGITDGANCTSYYNGGPSTPAANTDDFVWKRIGYYNGAPLINGYLAEILVFSRDLPANERKAVEGYLNGKYLLY